MCNDKIVFCRTREPCDLILAVLKAHLNTCTDPYPYLLVHVNGSMCDQLTLAVGGLSSGLVGFLRVPLSNFPSLCVRTGSSTTATDKKIAVTHSPSPKTPPPSSGKAPRLLSQGTTEEPGSPNLTIRLFRSMRLTGRFVFVRAW